MSSYYDFVNADNFTDANNFVGDKLLDKVANADCDISVRRLKKLNANIHTLQRVNSSNIEFNTYFKGSNLNDDYISYTASSDDIYTVSLYDQSSQNKHMIQANASSQPLVAESGDVLKINNKAVLNFDGLDDFYSTTFASLANDATYIFVYKLDTSSLEQFDSIFSNNFGSGVIGSFQLGFYLDGSVEIRYRSEADTAENFFAFEVDDNNLKVVTVTISNNTFRLYRNGEFMSEHVATNGFVDRASRYALAVNRNNFAYLPCFISEFIAYRRKLNDTELDILHKDIINYYNIV